MKILTDLGHPKNVHMLKNLAPRLAAMGHEVYCVWREREAIPELCMKYGLSGMNRGPGGASLLGKFYCLFKTDYQLNKIAKQIKPDLLLSFASPYLANLALLSGIPMIVFDDTEQNRLVQKIYAKAAAAIVVPACFGKDLSRRQFRFAGYFELAYLHPRYFRPDDSILKDLGVAAGEKFVLLRFVSWKAVHDISHHGLSAEQKKRLAAAFSGLARVFISAEGGLPVGLEPLRLKAPPERIHQVMSQASLIFSEGATMAAEAAVLGVPAVYISDLKPGYLRDLEERFGLLATFSHAKDGFADALGRSLEKLQSSEEAKVELAEKRAVLLAATVDVVSFLAWFVDQFPKSAEIMKVDPLYAKKFM